jgi:L-iditol 2-dehydrogenase
MKTIYFDKDIPRVLLTKAAAGSKKTWNLLYTGINAVKYKKDIPDPPLPAGNWVRVRNIACGLCGTDVSFFKATTGTDSAFEPIPASKKTFLGHENIGRVIEAGPNVTDFKVGDRVGIRAYMAGCDTKDLPRCKYCEEGNYNLCLNYGAKPRFDIEWTGAGWGDTFIAPQQQLYHIYDEISDADAPMIEPACVSVHAVLMAPPTKGEKILVMGCGTIGLGIVQAIKIVEPDCDVWIMERVPTKIEFARKLGADHVLAGDPMKATAEACGGSEVYQGMSAKNRYFFGGFNRIYDCIGGSWSNNLGVRLCAPRATFVKIGHHMCAITYDESPVWWQEIKLVGIDAHGLEEWEGRKLYTFDLVQEWIRDGKYSIDGFITNRFKLDNYKEAMKLALKNPPDVIKIALECE